MSTTSSNPDVPENVTAETETAVQKNIFQRLPSRTLLALVTAAVLIGWLLNTPPGLAGKADAVGYAICHQIYERSFTVNGQAIALCARCTGMYLGVVVAVVYQFFLGKRRAEWPHSKFLVVLGVFFLAFAVDGSNSALKLFLGDGLLYEPSNTMRVITGMGMGLTLGVMVLPTFNQTIWKAYDPRPYFEGWKQFGGLVAAGAAAVLLILTESPVILIPFSYISAFGVVLILVLLYSMILMVIFDRENHVERPKDFLPWLLAGLLVAFLHIGMIDYIRYMFTGTWEGFHLNLG